MKLGINLSHEASVAVTDESGVVIFAIEEERLSRQKGDNSFPINSLLAVSKLGLSESISEIIIGNSELQDFRDAVRFKMTVENFINPTSLNPKYNWSPRFKIPDSFLDLNPQLEIQNLILKLITAVVESLELLQSEIFLGLNIIMATLDVELA